MLSTAARRERKQGRWLVERKFFMQLDTAAPVQAPIFSTAPWVGHGLQRNIACVESRKRTSYVSRVKMIPVWDVVVDSQRNGQFRFGEALLAGP